MSTERVTVHCDDRFHEGESVELRTFTRSEGDWLIADPADDLLAGDLPYFEAGGTVEGMSGAETRERRRVQCDCGANLVLRAEKVEPLLHKLADGGVSSISLARLNLLVSRQA